jgi:hypothetical protein
MATVAYMTQRRKYQRPQGILWSENPGTLVDGLYVPTGYEVGGNYPEDANPNLIDQFLVLSDHNRNEMDFTSQRIEQRQRTINGRMRSYHIADKLQMSVSWTNLPSRSHDSDPNFSFQNSITDAAPYTADGGAGGSELLDWYENHKGSFWMFLAYDKYKNFENTDSPYLHLNQYNQVIEVYFSSFNYSVVRRGGSNHDLWNVTLSLEEA